MFNAVKRNQFFYGVKSETLRVIDYHIYIYIYIYIYNSTFPLLYSQQGIYYLICSYDTHIIRYCTVYICIDDVVSNTPVTVNYNA